MKMYYMMATLLIGGLFFSGCSSSQQLVVEEEEGVKNVILLIGDGMGLAQMSSAYYFGEGTPNFSRFKSIGLHQNTPVGKVITDSAAGATAFSTGKKSYNGAIGVDKDTMPLPTILEMASKAQKSTGVIATSSLMHATPASFYAHVKSRKLYEDIALDFVSAPIDYAAGGGLKFFNNRSDKRDLVQELKGKGVVVSTEKESHMPQMGKSFVGLLADDAMPKVSEGRGEFLTTSTIQAIDFLSKDQDGFFLMVEGSQIDWGGHDNDADYIIGEVLDFDRAIGAALDFAERDGNTLVIVTADHETGGFSLSAAQVFGQREYGAVVPTFSTGGHTASLIPVLAYGKGAENFSGIYQNTDIFFKMIKSLGW